MDSLLIYRCEKDSAKSQNGIRYVEGVVTLMGIVRNSTGAAERFIARMIESSASGFVYFVVPSSALAFASIEVKVVASVDLERSTPERVEESLADLLKESDQNDSDPGLPDHFPDGDPDVAG